MALFLLMALLSDLRADTVVALSASQTVSPGIPVNALELEELGIDPNLFLFTGNSLYGYTGLVQLDIIGDYVNPASSGSLTSAATLTILSLDSSGNVSGVSSGSLNGGSIGVNTESTGLSQQSQQTTGGAPEPGSLELLGAGMAAVGFIWLLRRGVRYGPALPHPVPAGLGTDSGMDSVSEKGRSPEDQDDGRDLSDLVSARKIAGGATAPTG